MRLPIYKSQEEEQDNSLDTEQPRIGFTKYSELIHGRLAMVGFVVLLGIEIILKHI